MTQLNQLARYAYDGVYRSATNLLATSPNVSPIAWLTASCISPLLLHEQLSPIRHWLNADGARLSTWVEQWFHPGTAVQALADEAWMLEHCAIDIQAALDQRDLCVDDLAPLLECAQAFPAALAGLHADLAAQGKIGRLLGQ